jgi:PAS domain S-box-containing protein
VKQTTQKTTETLDPYQTLFDSMQDGIFQIDLDGKYTLVNPAYAEMHGYKPEEMKKINTRQTWASPENWTLLFKEIKNRDLKNIMKQFLRKDGSTGWLELSIKTKLDSRGTPIAYEGVARDVTERRAIELAEMEARERAEFLIDLMVHDLNNINQGMMLPLELVAQDPTLPSKHKKPIEIAVAQILRSTEFIKNVKKLQMVLQQPVKLERRDIYGDVVKAADAVRRAFPSKKLRLKTSIKEGDVNVVADNFLTDLFFNLLHNSMKSDKKQAVVVELEVKRNKDGKIVVSLTDHGNGIPDEEKTRVLLRKRGSKGSGMGLALVKYLVERYNGSISIHDRISGKATEGTTISITLQEG